MAAEFLKEWYNFRPDISNLDIIFKKGFSYDIRTRQQIYHPIEYYFNVATVTIVLWQAIRCFTFWCPSINDWAACLYPTLGFLNESTISFASLYALSLVGKFGITANILTTDSDLRFAMTHMSAIMGIRHHNLSISPTKIQSAREKLRPLICAIILFGDCMIGAYFGYSIAALYIYIQGKIPSLSGFILVLFWAAVRIRSLYFFAYRCMATVIMKIAMSQLLTNVIGSPLPSVEHKEQLVRAELKLNRHLFYNLGDFNLIFGASAIGSVCLLNSDTIYISKKGFEISSWFLLYLIAVTAKHNEE